MSYETEEQQVEAIKKWWKENGTMFVAGIVITLGAVVGWRWWMDHRNAQAEAAAVEYQQLLAELGQGDKEAVIKRGGYLIDNYAATPYSDLAALALSRLRVDAGELAAARSRLEWVMNHAESPELRDVARLRLARVHLAAGNARQALEVLSALKNQAFAALADEVRGDVYVAMGDEGAARTAYQKALQASRPGSDTTLLRMKLDELGAAGA